MTWRIGAAGPFIQRVTQGDAASAGYLDEDGSGFWSATLALPAVKAAASVALASALCFGLQQQNEELTTPTAEPALSAPLLQQRATQFTSIRQWAQFEELPIAAPVLVDDDPGYIPLPLPPPRAIAPVFLADDERAPTVEETEWIPGSAQSRLVASLPIWADDEGIPHLSVDESEWQPSVTQSAIAVYLPPSGDDLPVTPPTVALDEDGFAPGAAITAQPRGLAAIADDDLPVVVPLEDDSWSAPLVFAPTPRTLEIWPNDEIETAATFVPSEDYWLQLDPPPTITVVVQLPGLGASGPSAPPAPAEDEPWNVYTPPAPGKCFVYLPDPESYPVLSTPPPPLSSGTASRRDPIRLYLWPATDDLPTPPTPLNIEEEDFRVWTPPLVAKQGLYLPDPEEIPAGLLIGAAYEDDSWNVYTPLPPGPKFLYLPDPEEIPAGGFRTIVEEDWNVWTPPLAGKQPLYLPDPEQVPGGLAVPTSIWDEVIENGITARELLRGLASIAAGKSSGLDLDLPVFRNLSDTLNRITAATDVNGNRLTVTLNLSGGYAIQPNPWDEVLDGPYTAREVFRIICSALLGKVAGLEVYTPQFRDMADAKARITATTDASGNRSSITLDPT